MTAEHDELLRSDYLEGLDLRPLDAVRAMRVRCVEAETGVSYLRRLVQGRLDIVRRERDRRAAAPGGPGVAESSSAASDVDRAEDLVRELVDVLGEGPRAGGVGRLSQTLEPTDLDGAFVAELDELTARLGVGPQTLDTDELAAVEDDFADLERRLSQRRQAFFSTIDALQAEITRRYRDGEATVDALLAADADPG